jgi:hypothetical protein
MENIMNTQGTSGHSVTVGLPEYEVVSYRGEIFGPFRDLLQAYAYANEKWPDQVQDEDRMGAGWDVQVAGS